MTDFGERQQAPDPAQAGRPAGPPRRAIAIAVAVIGIGAGTWVLGSGPDAASSPADPPAVAVVPDVPMEQQAPALSVAPAPSDAAYAAAARRGGERANRAYQRVAVPKPKSSKSSKSSKAVRSAG